MHKLVEHFRTICIIVLTGGILGVALWGHPAITPTAFAGRLGQTVPQPTATPTDTPVPTVTPTNTSSPPTDTPVPPPPTNTPSSNVTPTNTPVPGTTPEPTATNTPVTEPTTSPTTSPTPSPTPTPVPEFSLALAISGPSTAQQGEEIALTFSVTNPSEVEAEDVRIRDLLPANLILVSADAEDGGEVELESEGAGGTVILYMWPELAPGAQVRATMVVTVADEVSDGAVIDNLAVAFADNASGSTAGISIGLPPTILPLFK